MNKQVWRVKKPPPEVAASSSLHATEHLLSGGGRSLGATVGGGGAVLPGSSKWARQSETIGAQQKQHLKWVTLWSWSLHTEYNTCLGGAGQRKVRRMNGTQVAWCDLESEDRPVAGWPWSTSRDPRKAPIWPQLCPVQYVVAGGGILPVNWVISLAANKWPDRKHWGLIVDCCHNKERSFPRCEPCCSQ